MDIDAQLAAATKSVQDQIELAKQSLDNKFEAAERMVMMKAVDATIRMAQTPVQPTDPTT